MQTLVTSGMTGGSGYIGIIGSGYGGIQISTIPVSTASGLLTPIMRPPPLRLIPFIKQLITFGRVRKPFTQGGSISGRIRRSFSESVVFTSTTTKHIEEEVSVRGFVMRDRKSN